MFLFQVEKTIETLGLSKCANSKILFISGGERKRVNIGTELLTNPTLLLLDEPTSGFSHFLTPWLTELDKESKNAEMLKNNLKKKKKKKTERIGLHHLSPAHEDLETSLAARKNYFIFNPPTLKSNILHVRQTHASC